MKAAERKEVVQHFPLDQWVVDIPAEHTKRPTLEHIPVVAAEMAEPQILVVGDKTVAVEVEGVVAAAAVAAMVEVGVADIHFEEDHNHTLVLHWYIHLDEQMDYTLPNFVPS